MSEKNYFYVEWEDDEPKIRQREMKLTDKGWAVKTDEGNFHVAINGDSGFVPPDTSDKAIQTAIMKENLELGSLKIAMDLYYTRIQRLENLRDER